MRLLRNKWKLCGALLLSAVLMKANVVFYTDRGAFNAANPGLQDQTFGTVASNLGVGPGGSHTLLADLNSSTNSGMLPGLDISGAGGEIILGAGGLGSGFNDPSVVPLDAGLSPDLTFTFCSQPKCAVNPLGVSAASLNFLSLDLPNNSVQVLALDTANKVLGLFNLPGSSATGSGEFFGLTSSGDLIGQLQLISGPDPMNVDEVEFGNSVAAAPEPGSLALTLTVLGVAGLAFRAMRRKWQRYAR